MPGLVWAPLNENDLPGLRRLAGACLERDGGLPLLKEDQILRARLLSGPSIGARDEIGEVVAAAGLTHDADGGVTALGLVHPSFRSLGLGEQLVKWAQQEADGFPVRIAVEALSPTADSLLREHGMVQTFAETIMRHDLKNIPRVKRPNGIRTVAFDDDTATAFHTAYVRSFGDRPGFPDPTESEWLSFLREDREFRPDLSRVALDDEGEPVGFVTISHNWIDQVGVVPQWRGKGLGEHLTARSLTAIAESGAAEAWLAVNVDNPIAVALYDRLGFTAYGTRARYALAEAAATVQGQRA